MRNRSSRQDKSRLAVGLTSILFLVGAWSSPERTFGQSKPPSVHSTRNWPCAKGKDVLRKNDGHPVWLSSSALMERIIDKQPIKKPALLGKNNLQGEVIVQVLINQDGKIECTRGVKGHPLAISSVIDSVPKWVFKPYVVNGKPISILGIIIIPFDFRTARKSS